MSNSIILITAFYFCLSILLVFDFTWLLLMTPLVYFFKDKPGTRKIHQRAIPRAGGICILVTFCIVLLIWNFSGYSGFPLLSPLFFNVCLIVAVGIFMVGFFDDTTTFAILNKAKFILEFLIAAEVVLLFGIQFPEINLFGLIVLKNKLLLTLFSIFWMVGVANALNIIDGIDGLAGTFACISFTTIALLAAHAHAADVAVLCVIIVGCVIGFLLHNVSPARVFLGDTGSLFLGMLLSLFLMYMVSQPKEPFSINTAFLIAGFPIIDVAVAMGRRFFKAMLEGRGLYQCVRATTVADSEHTHHRLIYRGLNHTQATLIIATLSAALCITAIHINLFGEFKYALVVYMVVVVFSFLYELNFFDRFIFYFKVVLLEKTGKFPYRIGVVDADPILHHALINFPQRKFRFEFISQKEININDTVPQFKFQPAINPNEQFLVSSTWNLDTRVISTKMIRTVFEAQLKSPTSEPSLREEIAVQSDQSDSRSLKKDSEYSAIVVNCCNAEEYEKKVALGQWFLERIPCAVIMVMDKVPDPDTCSNTMRQFIYIGKPFYVPIFLKELYQLIKKWKDWENRETMLKTTTVLKSIAGYTS
jgi:UDP-GlcNAc:undecaprenyl-phosphate/decaprenyl-phosphate GlcNAc-1-phosphate transferase